VTTGPPSSARERARSSEILRSIRPDRADDPGPHHRLAAGAGCQRQGDLAEARLGRRREAGFHRLLEPQRDDVGSGVAPGDPGGHPPPVGQHDLGPVGLRKDLRRGDHDIAAPQNTAARPGTRRVDAHGEALRRGRAGGKRIRQSGEGVFGCYGHRFLHA
jgi:hypothetical protein